MRQKAIQPFKVAKVLPDRESYRWRIAGSRRSRDKWVQRRHITDWQGQGVDSQVQPIEITVLFIHRKARQIIESRGVADNPRMLSKGGAKPAFLILFITAKLASP